jgi:hypothetical protein
LQEVLTEFALFLTGLWGHELAAKFMAAYPAPRLCKRKLRQWVAGGAS